jgi:Ca2+-binding EF-hand superfamily protein
MTDIFMTRPATVLCTVLLGAIAAGVPGKVVAQPEEEKRAQVAESFKHADVNRDGHLTPSEFKSFIDAIAEHDIGRSKTIKARKIYARAFAKLDRDDDGLVQRIELQASKSLSP